MKAGGGSALISTRASAEVTGSQIVPKSQMLGSLGCKQKKKTPAEVQLHHIMFLELVQQSKARLYDHKKWNT